MPAPTLILASRSPRRASLLREAGFTFEQIDPPFADPPTPAAQRGTTTEGLAMKLAREKAMSITAAPADGVQTGKPPLPEPCVLLCADTIVVGPQRSLMGQPRDREEARWMLLMLIEATHHVVTGVYLAPRPGAEADGVGFADTARVRIGRVSPDQVQKYLVSEAWRGKAGGYNLAELKSWPITVEGDPASVVGLPMRKLVPALGRVGVLPAAPSSPAPA